MNLLRLFVAFALVVFATAQMPNMCLGERSCAAGSGDGCPCLSGECATGMSSFLITAERLLKNKQASNVINCRTAAFNVLLVNATARATAPVNASQVCLLLSSCVGVRRPSSLSINVLPNTNILPQTNKKTNRSRVPRHQV